jgi:hypothetical protein
MLQLPEGTKRLSWVLVSGTVRFSALPLIAINSQLAAARTLPEYAGTPSKPSKRPAPPYKPKSSSVIMAIPPSVKFLW